MDQTTNQIKIHSWESKVYLTIEDAFIVLENISGPSATFFDDVHWFDGTLTYTAYVTTEHTDPTTGLTYRTRDTVTKNLPNLGYTDTDLDLEWMWVYGDRFLAIPVVPIEYCSNYNDFRYRLSLWVTKVTSRLAQLNASRGYSYKKLVSTLDIDYDPISNYDAMEHELSAEQEGTHTVSRTGNDSKEVTNSYAIPNATMTVETDSSGQVTAITDVAPTTDSDTTTTVVDGSTTVTPNTTDSTYTTTYNDTNERLNSKTTSTGSNTTSDDTTTTTDSHSTPKYSRSETSGYRGYTDTYSATTPNNHGRIMNRTGNIGVTTTQQMLQQERNIARINVIQEYMEDINHHMLLSIY